MIICSHGEISEGMVLGTTLLFPGDGEPPATLTQLSINGSLVFSASTAPNSYQVKGILTHVNLKGPHKNQTVFHLGLGSSHSKSTE